MDGPEKLAERFEHSRPRLLAIANRLLASTADAEDAVQETWLRLVRSDDGAIDNLEAWLTTVVSRISLDQLRAPRRRRELSWQVAPWGTGPVSPDGDPEGEALRRDQVGVALLVVLEVLSPAERVAFVLHDVFGRPFEEIADVLERSVQASRQLASRARHRVRAGSRTADDGVRPQPWQAREMVDAWLAAARDGDFNALLALLDGDAVLHADYGTGSQILHGARVIAEQAVLSARLAAHSTPLWVGGRPGVAATMHGRVVSLMAFTIAGGRIKALDVLADAQRLRTLEVTRMLGPAWPNA